jgi:hypothetical protein
VQGLRKHGCRPQRYWRWRQQHWHWRQPHWHSQHSHRPCIPRGRHSWYPHSMTGNCSWRPQLLQPPHQPRLPQMPPSRCCSCSILTRNTPPWSADDTRSMGLAGGRLSLHSKLYGSRHTRLFPRSFRHKRLCALYLHPTCARCCRHNSSCETYARHRCVRYLYPRHSCGMWTHNCATCFLPSDSHARKPWPIHTAAARLLH